LSLQNSARPNLELVAVERIISELRAGRAIILRHNGQQVSVLGVESVQAADLTPHSRLILTAARLRWLGMERAGGGAIATNQIGATEAIVELAQGRVAKVPAQLLPTSEIEQAALVLAKLALVLPAVVVTPQAGLEGALTADASAVHHFAAARIAALHIIGRAPVPLDGAEDSEFVVFRGGEGLRDQVAIIIGAPDLRQPVPVRLHSACLTGDLFGSLKCDCGDQLRSTAKAMAANGGGIILYLDQEGRGTGIGNKMRAYGLQAEGFDTFDADEVLGFEHDERHFQFAAKMLQLLGISHIRLMTNNPLKAEALRESGLNIVETLPVLGRITAQNHNYLATKRDRGGHMLARNLDVAKGAK